MFLKFKYLFLFSFLCLFRFFVFFGTPMHVLKKSRTFRWMKHGFGPAPAILTVSNCSTTNAIRWFHILSIWLHSASSVHWLYHTIYKENRYYGKFILLTIFLQNLIWTIRKLDIVHKDGYFAQR